MCEDRQESHFFIVAVVARNVMKATKCEGPVRVFTIESRASPATVGAVFLLVDVVMVMVVPFRFASLLLILGVLHDFYDETTVRVQRAEEQRRYAYGLNITTDTAQTVRCARITEPRT